MESAPLPPDFDAWKQQINLTSPDGSLFSVNMEDFNMIRLYAGRLGINYGSQVGASIMLLLVLFLLTRSEKRRSSIFVINAICLALNTIRCILLACYITSTLFNPFFQLTGDWSHVASGDVASTTVANILTIAITFLIMISLSLQVWVVCVTTAPVQRYIIMGVTTVMACVATGFKAAFLILTIKQSITHGNMERYKYIVATSYITQAAAIFLFSFVFTYKLGYAIMQRRRLNMPQFGPMQIVFIMGCQTMLIPAIFSLLQFRDDVTELGVIVTTVVCIFLPLSAIWAGVVSETIPAGSGPDSHRRLIQSEFYRSAPSSSASSNASNTLNEKTRQFSVCTCSSNPKSPNSIITTPSPRDKSMRMYDDENIRITRDFGIDHKDAV